MVMLAISANAMSTMTTVPATISTIMTAVDHVQAHRASMTTVPVFCHGDRDQSQSGYKLLEK